MLLIPTLIIIFIIFFSSNKLKINLKNLINSNKYESVTLDHIITDSDKLYISFYIENEYKCLSDSLEIRNTVKDYLKNMMNIKLCV